MMKEEWKHILRGRRFYTALAVCLTVAALGGGALFVNSRSVTAPAAPVLQPSASQLQEETVRMPEAAAPEAEQEEPEAVIATPTAGTADLPQAPEAPQPSQETAASAPAAQPPTAAGMNADEPITPAPPTLVVSPLQGEVLTVFAVDRLVYSPTLGDWRIHDGLDIAAKPGTTVRSASAGTVAAVEQDAMMGTTVVIDHPDGYQTTYANLQAQPTVKVGDEVNTGQIIGAVGQTAAAESGIAPHLHFAVTKDGDVVDPEVYLK